MINWDYAPHPERSIDRIDKFYKYQNDSNEDLWCNLIDGNLKGTFMYISTIEIETEPAYHEYGGVLIDPPVCDLWEVEMLIARPVMKCWGRGLNK